MTLTLPDLRSRPFKWDLGFVVSVRIRLLKVALRLMANRLLSLESVPISTSSRRVQMACVHVLT